jgi:threonylcarbamoyladenosine tRNA methylthiotransferase MtaB
LLQRLIQIPGLIRLRLSSIEPSDFTPELLRTVAESEVICPHFHIPLQSGDEAVLRRMGRPYTTEVFNRLVQELRQARPGVAITTDVMVGFPGESEQEFARSYALVEHLRFSRLHVFQYSPRRGTVAAGMPRQVLGAVKAARSKQMLALSRKLSRAYAAEHLGRSMEILVERQVKRAEGFWEGHTANYLRVVFPGPEKLEGRFVPVVLLKVRPSYVEGRIDSRIE